MRPNLRRQNRKNMVDVLDDPELTEWQRAMLFQNVQRTRLSNERNFLNWVRASLAFITLGFIVHRFGLVMGKSGGSAGDLPTSLTIGVPLIFFGLGGAMVALGTWEFFRVRKETDTGEWSGINIIRDILIVTMLLSLLVILAVFVLESP